MKTYNSKTYLHTHCACDEITKPYKQREQIEKPTATVNQSCISRVHSNSLESVVAAGEENVKSRIDKANNL